LHIGYVSAHLGLLCACFALEMRLTALEMGCKVRAYEHDSICLH
jgi:hypothetical protein